MMHGFARWAGIWPDGAPYIAGETDWQAHTLTAPFPFSVDDNVDPTDWIHEEVLHGINAITRAHGEKTGFGFDNQPYDAEAPDAWSLSATWRPNPVSGRRRNPRSGLLPWWIVRQPPPS
ncbi:MAG: hypothetical protein WDN06_08155 [Asticcacaulis sp.]